MSSTVRQSPRSKFRLSLFHLGGLLVGISLFGFVYSFLPAKTKTSEKIDLGTILEKLKLSGSAEPHSPNKDQELAQIIPVLASFTMPASQQTPTPLQRKGCSVEGVPASIEEGLGTLILWQTCNGQPVDPEIINVDITAGTVRPQNNSTLIVNSSGLAGKTVTLSLTLSGCGTGLCQKQFPIEVTQRKRTRTLLVNVVDSAGKGIPGATVTISDQAPKQTGANGQVEFTNLTTGKYSVSAAARGFNTGFAVQELRVDTFTLKVPLTPVPESSLSRPPASPSPRVSPSPSVQVSPSPRVSPAATPTASATATVTPAPAITPPIFAPGKNGSLLVSWPTTITKGWSNLCEVTYEPPPGSLPEGYELQAKFFLKPITGVANKNLHSSFQPLDWQTHLWSIALEPDGERGSPVEVQLMMSVKIQRDSDATKEIEIQPLRSTIDEKLLTRIQTQGGSAVSGVLGIGLMFTRGRRKKGEETESEPERYIDVTLYEDHLYPGDNLEEETKVPDDVSLIANELYTLEVAVRLNRTGIASDKPAPRQVENPRQAQETLTLHILATPITNFKITDTLATVSWPFNQDSESALFRLEIDSSFDRTRPGKIEIRILDDSFDLLEVVMLEVAIVAEKAASRTEPGFPYRKLTWEDKESEGLLLAGSSIPRLASIRVRRETGGFNFELVFRSESGNAVNISMSRKITPDDLNNLLVKVRDFWTRLVITNFAHQLTVSESRYQQYLKELRDLGIQAWALLTGTRTADQEGTSERVGHILASLDEKGFAGQQQLFNTNTIQITYADDSDDFIFPWSILHPPTSKEDKVDPLRFWGARYQIEQVTKGPRRDRIDNRPVNVLFALDPSFGDAPSQKKMFEDYQAAAKGALVVSPPISDRRTLFEQLTRNPAAELLYFYCHGYAATRPGVLSADGVQSLKRMIEAIRQETNGEDSTTAAAFEKLMELTSKMAGESWIYLGDAEIKETELRLQNFFARPRRPIVLLNMCQSADLVPSMSTGLVRLFLDHNASAVIGTESPMTAVFADAFARMLLDALFAGDNIGTALWKARRHFLLEGRNPLGLAYTLYGRANAKLGNQDLPFVVPARSKTDGQSIIPGH